MKKTSSVLIIICLSLTAVNTAILAQPLNVTFESLLREMSDRTVLTHWPEHEYKSLQSSSYNRASKTPADPEGWFANADCGFDLGTEINQGRKEAILMKHEGPGVLTRIWTPFFYKNFNNRKGKDIMIYLDGDTVPTIKSNFIELLTGKGLVLSPFAQYTCRAGDLYLPISFNKSCKITIADSSFFYIINYRAYNKDVKVETFRPEFLNQYKGLLSDIGKELVKPQDYLKVSALSLNKKLLAGENDSLQFPQGANAVRQLEFKIQAGDIPQALRSTVLEMNFDNEKTVWCPMGDFFANVGTVDPYRMWEREVRSDGTMICRWVMPYKNSGNLRIHNLGSKQVTITVKTNISPWKWNNNSLHFHANWWTDVPYAPRPVKDMNFIEINGRGMHVGDNLIVLNPHWSWWGEGDEKIYVNEDIDKHFPSHWGTGSEDYYGWAGGEVPNRKDEFSTPFLANVRVGGQHHPNEDHSSRAPFTRGYNICTRTRSMDATPFVSRFKFDMEAFNMISSPEAYLQYALVTFWYGSPGATHNRPPMPEAASAKVPQPEDVEAFAQKELEQREKLFHIQDAIELESLNGIIMSPDLKCESQKVKNELSAQKFSNEAILVAKNSKTGDSAVFTLNEQYHPKRILLYPATSLDFGKLNIYFNDKLIIPLWDGFSQSLQSSKPIDLGIQSPDGNVFRLKIKVMGKNEASCGYLFGLDCVVLKNPEDPK